MIRPVNANNISNVGSVDILNSIRRELGGQYEIDVPLATDTVESMKMVGEAILGFDAHRNAFYQALKNRIAFSIVKGKMYTNPWQILKKGILELGDTIEEIFVGLCDPQNYDPEVAESEVFKRVVADVRTAFHTRNYQKFYKTTTYKNELSKAFLSTGGIAEFTNKLIESMYKSAEQDEFLVMKYFICRLILDGKLHAEVIADPTTNLKSTIETIQEISNNFEFLNPDFNMSGVDNFSLKADQYIIIDANTDAKVSVELLATAFNMSFVEFTPHKILIDSFSKQNLARLAKIFKDDPAYVAFTSPELVKLASVKAILLDREFFLIYDNLIESSSIYNQDGLYWNDVLHTQKTFSASPFENATVFTVLPSTITSVSVTPATVTLPKNVIMQLYVTVETGGFAKTDVEWSSSSPDSFIDDLGRIRIGSDEGDATVTFTATSKVDPSKTDTCVVTVA